MYITNQKEMFSKAYVSAIASFCGCNISRRDVDDDSVDITLIKKDMRNTFVDEAELQLQLKCTKLKFDKNNFLSYRIPIKNYNDLRKKTLIPRLLVIVCVPDNFEECLEEQDEQMILRKKAFWYKIEDSGAKNSKTVTVKIPRHNIFNTQFLNEIMIKIANGIDV